MGNRVIASEDKNSDRIRVAKDMEFPEWTLYCHFK